MSANQSLTTRHLLVILVVALTFLFFGIGAQQWGWDFDKLATLFLIMGLVSGSSVAWASPEPPTHSWPAPAT